MQFEKVTRPPENVLGQEYPSSQHVGCKFKVPLLQQLSDLDAFLDSFCFPLEFFPSCNLSIKRQPIKLWNTPPLKNPRGNGHILVSSAGDELRECGTSLITVAVLAIREILTGDNSLKLPWFLLAFLSSLFHFHNLGNLTLTLRRCLLVSIWLRTLILINMPLIPPLLCQSYPDLWVWKNLCHLACLGRACDWRNSMKTIYTFLCLQYMWGHNLWYSNPLTYTQTHALIACYCLQEFDTSPGQIF